MLWKELANRGIERHDPSTWTLPVVRLDSPEEGPFVSAGTAPNAADEIDVCPVEEAILRGLREPS